MIIGYLRVSTKQQNLENQELEIRRFAGFKNLSVDEFIQVSISTRKSQKERRIDELLSKLNSGDSLIVTELSRLGRSVSEVISLIETLIEKKVRLIIIKQNLDIDSSSGKRVDPTSKLILNIFSSIAELERDMISERTKMGLERAKQSGIKLGRPKGKYSSKLDSIRDRIIELHQLGVSKINISKQINVNYQTLCGYMKKVEIA